MVFTDASEDFGDDEPEDHRAGWAATEFASNLPLPVLSRPASFIRRADKKISRRNLQRALCSVVNRIPKLEARYKDTRA